MDSPDAVTIKVELYSQESEETVEPHSQETIQPTSQGSQDSQDSQDLNYASPFHNPLDNWAEYAAEKWTARSPKADDIDMDLSPIPQSPASSWADNDFSPASTNFSFDHCSSNELSPAAFVSPTPSLARSFNAAFRSLSPDPAPDATVSPADLSCASSPTQSPRSALFTVGSRHMDCDMDDVQDGSLEDELESSDSDRDQTSECDELIDEDPSVDYEPSRPLKLKNWDQTPASSSVPSTSNSKRSHRNDSDDEHEEPITKQKRTYGRGTKSSFRGRNKAGHRVPLESKSRNEGTLTLEEYFALLEEAKSKFPAILPFCSIRGCDSRNKPWKRFQDWDRHMTTHTPDAARPTCPHCKSTFSRKDALSRHLNGTCNGK